MLEVVLPPEWQQAEFDSLFVHVIGGDWGKDQDFDHPDFIEAFCIRGAEFKHWNKNSNYSGLIYLVCSVLFCVKTRKID